MAELCPRPVDGLQIERIARFLGEHYGLPEERLRLECQPLHGGLSSTVTRVRAELIGDAGRPRTADLVVKTISGDCHRELAAYQTLLSGSALPMAPRLLGADCVSDSEAYLYLEWIRCWRRWPWTDTDVTGMVLDRLAYAHATLPPARYAGALATWDYESELLRSARSTLGLVEAMVRDPQLAPMRRLRRPLKRLVTALPAIRRALRENGPRPVVLHGDAHPGNVIVRRHARGLEPVLVDWARARLGSPLEDVCSWLQSLAYWEPEARRRHDTLAQRYLAARGQSTCLGANFRELYWLAGACNAMAGALRFHLLRMADEGCTAPVRARSAHAAHDWLRIVRRADACWRN